MSTSASRFPIGCVVVGRDSSRQADGAFRASVAIARRTGARLVVAHAAHVPGDPPPSIAGSPELAARWRRAFARRDAETEEWLARSRSATNPLGVKLTQVALDDHADTGLVALAAQRAADLLVIGARGEGGTDSELGSIAARVARAAPCPVLVTRSVPVKAAFRRVLVAIDFSSTAERALRVALAVAGDDALVDLVYVMNPVALALDSWVPSVEGAARDERDQAVKTVYDWVAANGEELVARYRGKRRLQFSIAEGRPARELLRTIEQDAYDLVAVGSHGYRGLRRLVLGSVADSTVRSSPCSVLVVRPAAGDPY